MESASQITSEAARDEFLTLLVNQLQHQDPLDPVPQHEFLGQLAQFSTLEGIESLNGTFSNMLKLQQVTQAGSVVGQTAMYPSPAGDGKVLSGVVDEVQIVDGSLEIKVDGLNLGIDDVIGFSDIV